MQPKKNELAGEIDGRNLTSFLSKVAEKLQAENF
jgi:hypothetical protein